MNENSHRTPRGDAEATERLAATERLDATEKLASPLAGEPTEVLSRVVSPAPGPRQRAAAPASSARATAAPVHASATPSKAPTDPARRGRSAAAPVIAVLGLVASVLLAMFAWGGLFTMSQLACVIAGSVLFTLAGIVGMRACKGTGGLIFTWIVAFVLLFAPLLGWIAAQGGASLTSTLLLGAIGMWISGVAVVALVVAVLGTYLHARAAAQ